MNMSWKKSLIITLIIIVVYGGIYLGIKIYNDNKHAVVETEITLSQYNILINDKTIITTDGKNNQQVIVVKKDDEYSLKITGEKNREYEFIIEDENGSSFVFVYSFDDNKNLSLRIK